MDVYAIINSLFPGFAILTLLLLVCFLLMKAKRELLRDFVESNHLAFLALILIRILLYLSDLVTLFTRLLNISSIHLSIVPQGLIGGRIGQ